MPHKARIDIAGAGIYSNRYKSILCAENPLLLELVRFIHLNPIRAMKVRNIRNLNGYPYWGHSVIMVKVVAKWQDATYILSLCGKMFPSPVENIVNSFTRGLRSENEITLLAGG
jgi:hypothetical protein